MSITTLVVQYGESVPEEDRFAVAELDDTMNLDRNGEVKTQFSEADEPYFLVHLKPGLYVESVLATNAVVFKNSMFQRTVISRGGIIKEGQMTLQRGQILSVFNEEGQELSYYPAGLVEIDSATDLAISGVVTGRQMTISGALPVNIYAQYPVSFTRYRFIPPSIGLGPEESCQFFIVINVEALS